MSAARVVYWGVSTRVTSQELSPPVEAAHLRRLLDTQPSCLMRLGAEGTVLAANDAALMLLGLSSRAQALGNDFALWIAADHRERWRAFSASVIDGAPASVECDLMTPSGDRQATLFHAVPLRDHPDGFASIAVAARAVAGQRQLEAAVVEREEALREFEIERRLARARLDELETARQQTDAALQQSDAALQQALADRRQLERTIEDLTAQQQRLLDERAAERQRVLQTLQSITESHEREIEAARRGPELQRVTAERDALREAFDALTVRLERMVARVEEHEAVIQERDAECRRLAAAHQAAVAERDRLLEALRRQAAALSSLAEQPPARESARTEADT